MEHPSRSTKSRAQRIERHYFKNRFGIPRWRIRLTLIGAVIGLGWIGWRALARDETAFSSGPLNSHHASFEKNCAACHVLRSSMGTSVTDQACLKCHDGPVHRDEQTSTPKCVDCHIEHAGAPRLLSAGDKTCIECHSNLKTKSGKLLVAQRIDSLASGHPEFIALRPGHQDPGSIKFNHKVHLKKDLKGPNGNVNLDCGDCHRPTGIRQAWPYGTLQLSDTDTVAASLAPAQVPTRAYMEQVEYYRNCSTCHPLGVDKRISEPAPHKKPEIVIAFLQEQFRNYINVHPDELEDSTGSVRLPRVKAAPSPSNADEWVRQRVEEAERLLWTKTCAECHAIDGVGSLPVPVVRKANLTARWLERGNFDHAAHSATDCASCHARVNNSEKTSDVLIPGIENCRSCHSSGKGDSSASGQCFECHQYHDWSREKPRHGVLRVPHT